VYTRTDLYHSNFVSNYFWDILERLLVRYVMTGCKFHCFPMNDYLLPVVCALDLEQHAVEGPINISSKTCYKHR
jgi:hypothetical protein